MAELATAHVEVGGVSFRYALLGEGVATVVLVGGLGDTIESWANQLDDLLAAGFRVLCFDNRGAGETSTTPGPYTTRLLADDTKALTAKLGLGEFHLVGGSLGGMIAQEYTLAYERDLYSLTLACTYARPGPYTARLLSFWEDLALASSAGHEFVLRDALLHCFPPEIFERAELLAEVEHGFEPTQSLGGFLAQIAAARTHDTLDRLGAISTPTLVVAADGDALIPPAAARALADAIPGAELRTLPGGHGFTWTQAAAFNSTIVEFLDELAPDARGGRSARGSVWRTPGSCPTRTAPT